MCLPAVCRSSGSDFQPNTVYRIVDSSRVDILKIIIIYPPSGKKIIKKEKKSVVVVVMVAPNIVDLRKVQRKAFPVETFPRRQNNIFIIIIKITLNVCHGTCSRFNFPKN